MLICLGGEGILGLHDLRIVPLKPGWREYYLHLIIKSDMAMPLHDPAKTTMAAAGSFDAHARMTSETCREAISRLTSPDLCHPARPCAHTLSLSMYCPVHFF
jgi:hypothetical protein